MGLWVRIPQGTWIYCVVCVLQEGQKGKSQNNPDKITSADELQREKKRIKKSRGRAKIFRRVRKIPKSDC